MIGTSTTCFWLWTIRQPVPVLADAGVQPVAAGAGTAFFDVAIRARRLWSMRTADEEAGLGDESCIAA